MTVTLKKIAINISLVALLVAISVGLIGRIQPSLLLNVPHVGFILWMLTGNSLPPFLNAEPWRPDEMQTWIKDNDVVVSTGIKSGTTWMLYCSHLIRSIRASSDHPFVDPSYTTPWPDLVQVPGDSWSDTKRKMNDPSFRSYWDSEEYPFRIFKAHHWPGDIPPGGQGQLFVRSFPKVKFLGMVRNGLDTVASLVPFLPAHTDEFRQMWGGFPPLSTGSIKSDAAARLADVLPGGALSSMYFEYVKGWWAMRHEPNVLLLHYSDALRDPVGTIAKLAAFYGVDLSEQEIQSIAQECSFANMKRGADLFLYQLPLNPSSNATMMKSGTMIRKGVNGDGKVVFTDRQREIWEQAIMKEFVDPEMRVWAANGGEFS